MTKAYLSNLKTEKRQDVIMTTNHLIHASHLKEWDPSNPHSLSNWRSPPHPQPPPPLHIPKITSDNVLKQNLGLCCTFDLLYWNTEVALFIRRYWTQYQISSKSDFFKV